MKILALQLRYAISMSALLLIMPFGGSILWAQQTASEVDIANQELASVAPLEFTSYVGPHASVDSLEEIINIGAQLANLDEDGRSSYGGKYFLEHIAAGGQLFSADILRLDEGVRVDHIRNLRHIISGYLQNRYAYESTDAYTISTFITYYNAYYRRKAEYFQERFNAAVNAAISPDIVGLSTNYADWPGATQIIIPLSAISALEQTANPNLDETGQSKISQYLYDKEEDKQAATELRQGMLDLRQEKLNDEQNILAEKQTALQQDNRQNRGDLEAAKIKAATADNPKEREDAQQQQQQLESTLQDNQKEQNELNVAQQTIAQRQEVLNKNQRQLQLEEPQPQSKQILPDDKETIIVLLPVRNRSFQFYAVDRSDLKIKARSEVNSIRSTEFVARDDAYIVVAGTQKNNRRIRLLKLSKELNREMHGADDIHPDSGVWEHQGQLFAFLATGHLARFNEDLQLQARSIDVMRRNFRPQFSRSYGLDSYALVQNRKREFVWLDLVTLSQREQLIPTK